MYVSMSAKAWGRCAEAASGPVHRSGGTQRQKGALIQLRLFGREARTIPGREGRKDTGHRDFRAPLCVGGRAAAEAATV